MDFRFMNACLLLVGKCINTSTQDRKSDIPEVDFPSPKMVADDCSTLAPNCLLAA